MSLTEMDAPYRLNPRIEKEYLSSMSFGTWKNDRAQVLPRYIDDVTYFERVDLYEQMLLDAQVRANFNTLVYGILGGGIDVIPASNSEPDMEVADSLRQALFQTLEETPLGTEVLPDMLKAMAVGYRIAEVVFYNPGDSPQKGKYAFRRIKVKSREDAQFYVDAQMNLIGIAGRTKDKAAAPPGSIFLDSQTVVIPRDKFMVLSWKPTAGDFRGTSDLRAAYNAWWQKQQLLPIYLQYMGQFATPSIWAELPPNAGRRSVMESDGTQATEDGEPVVSDPASDLLTEIMKMQSSSVLVVKNGTKLNVIQSQSDGRPFPMAIDLWNYEITKAMTGQIMATDNVGTAGKAAGTHKEILDLPIGYGCAVVERMIQKDLADPYVRLNYPAGTPSPTINLPGANKADFLAEASAVSKLLLTNVIPPEMWPEIYARLGFSQPSSDILGKLVDQWYKERENAANPPGLKSRLASDGQNIEE